MLTLTPVMEKFVLHWGEMGTQWGVSRSVSQIHALLYLAPRPLNAEEIAATLSVARSNVSTSLKELQAWKLVRRVNVLGDRRDHFETHADVWDMFQIILDERKRREIDPTLELLRELVDESKREKGAGGEVHERLGSMLEFFESMSRWYTQIRALPQGAMIRFVKMGSKVSAMLGTSARGS